MSDAVAATADGVRLTVRVQPRASRDEIAGVIGDAVKVRLRAPPVDGAANAALSRLLARRLGIPPGAVTIRSGHGARRKSVEVRGLTVEAVRAALGV